MTRLAKLLLPLLLIAGCTASATVRTNRAAVRDESPPPTREETVEYRAGMVWVHGHWDRDAGRWQWKPGYYEPERAGYVYIEGRWAPSNRGYVWVDGTWRKREGIALRERRF